MDIKNNNSDVSKFISDFNMKKPFSIAICSFTMLIHLLYLIFFFRIKVYFMGAVNIASVLFYASGIIYLCIDKDAGQLMGVALIEIVTHAILATIFMGWDYGFQMFLICMIPIPYMIMTNEKPIIHIISGSIIAVFLVLRISCVDLGFHAAGNIPDIHSSAWYIFNSFMSFIVILLVTIFFRSETRRLTKSLSEQNSKLQKAASLDSLTGLFNRRAMGTYLEQLSNSSVKCCMALMDIDYFKHVNDTYGHAAGDKVLIEISQFLMKDVPSEGYICRWGGEEILVVIPGMDIDSGSAIAERIRSEIEDMRFACEERAFGITVTIGVCEYTSKDSVDEAIKTADDRLYEGKRRGRNCVVCS